jgi:hypothetical protein
MPAKAGIQTGVAIAEMYPGFPPRLAIRRGDVLSREGGDSKWVVVKYIAKNKNCNT